MCLQCVLNYHYLPSIQKIHHLGPIFLLSLEKFHLFHWAGNWAKVKVKFLIEQKSVKLWLRYLNCSFKDINQCFGGKKSYSNRLSEVLLLHCMLFCFLLKYIKYFGGKRIVPIFWDLKCHSKTWKFFSIHLFSSCSETETNVQLVTTFGETPFFLAWYRHIPALPSWANTTKWQSFPGEKSIPYRCIPSDTDTFASAKIQEVFWESKAEVQVYKVKLWNKAVRDAHLPSSFLSKCVISWTSLETQHLSCLQIVAKGHSQPLPAYRTLCTALLHSNYSYLSTNNLSTLTACIARTLMAKHKIKILQVCMLHMHTRRRSPCLERSAE